MKIFMSLIMGIVKLVMLPIEIFMGFIGGGKK